MTGAGDTFVSVLGGLLAAQIPFFEAVPVANVAAGIAVSKVGTAIQRSNVEVGGRLVEISEREFMVRGRGYIKEIRDLENVVLGSGSGGVPILLKDVANVSISPVRS